MYRTASRWAVSLAAALVATGALAQDIYTWTDDEGVEQFTDDPSRIPEKFRKKARVTTGSDINVVSGGDEAAPPRARPAAQPAPRATREPEGPNKCVVLKRKVSDLEFSIGQQKTAYEERVRACSNNAARVTRTGRVVPVRGCSETNGPTQLKARLEADQRKLEQLNDELRVVQHQGC